MLIKKIAFFFLILSCSGLVLACAQNKTFPLSINNTTFVTEIAHTPKLRAQGLMHRKYLPNNQAMLFIFPYEGVQDFWMKDTLIALDIAFVDKNGLVRTIKSMQPLNLTTISSEVPVLYAIEVAAGVFKLAGLKKGDKITLPPNLPIAQ
jgi:uncharacterized membrane protein (UPF0127 family)